MIVSANVTGILTGEWKGAPAQPRCGLIAGLVLLAAATVLIAVRNR